jgi:hypothetical protein
MQLDCRGAQRPEAPNQICCNTLWQSMTATRLLSCPATATTAAAAAAGCQLLFCAAAIKVFLNDGDEEADFIMQVKSAQDGARCQHISP